MSRRIFASSSTTRMRANTTPGRAQDGSALGTRLHHSRCRGRAAFSSQGAGLGILDGLESANVRFWPKVDVRQWTAIDPKRTVRTADSGRLTNERDFPYSKRVLARTASKCQD